MINRPVKATPEAKEKAKAAMKKMYGPGDIKFSVSSNGGHSVSHEDPSFGDTYHHTYHPTIGKVEPNHYMFTGDSDAHM